MPTPPLSREDDAVLAELARAKTEALVQAGPDVDAHKQGVADVAPPARTADPHAEAEPGK